MSNIATNLIGKRGVASIWREVATPCEIVAAYSHGDRLRVVVKATEDSFPKYHSLGRLYDTEASNITLNS